MAVTLVVTVALFGLVAAIGLPVAIDQIEGETTDVITQDLNEQVNVNAELTSNLTAVNASSNATYELVSDGSTISNTINVNANATYSFDNGDVVVGVETVNSGNATANFTYNNDFAYSDSARSIWDILGLAIVLAAFLFVLGIGLSASNRI